MKERNKAIDGLRGIMIMFIVLLHSCSFGITWYAGSLGNLFFFMISGYLLYQSRVLNDYRNKAGYNSLFVFLFYRLKKIYPAYFISLIVLVLIDGINTLPEFLSNVFLIDAGWIWDNKASNGPTWFLSVLVLIYVLFYSLIKCVHKEKIIYVLGFSFWITYGISIQRINGPFLYSRTMMGIAAFCMGAIVCHIQAKYFYNYQKNGFINRLLEGTFLLILISCFILGIDRTVNDMNNFMYLFLVCPLLIIISTRDCIMSKVLAVFPLSFLGRYSMLLFIWHVPFIHIMKRVHVYEYISTTNIQGVLYECMYLIALIVWCWLYDICDQRIRMIISNKYKKNGSYEWFK